MNSDNCPTKDREIDSQATHDKVRAKYGSIPTFCGLCGVTPRTYYFAVSGKRGQSRRKSEAKKLLARLDHEGLLVFADDQAGTTAAG